MRELPFFVETWVNGKKIGSKRLPDPLANTTVTISVRDMIKSILRGRRMKILVNVHGDRDTWKPLTDLRQELPEEPPSPVEMDGAHMKAKEA